MSKIKYRTFEQKTEDEVQADILTSRLLAYACVLLGLKLHTFREISKVCGISLQFATIRERGI